MKKHLAITYVLLSITASTFAAFCEGDPVNKVDPLGLDAVRTVRSGDRYDVFWLFQRKGRDGIQVPIGTAPLRSHGADGGKLKPADAVYLRSPYGEGFVSLESLRSTADLSGNNADLSAARKMGVLKGRVFAAQVEEMDQQPIPVTPWAAEMTVAFGIGARTCVSQSSSGRWTVTITPGMGFAYQGSVGSPRSAHIESREGKPLSGPAPQFGLRGALGLGPAQATVASGVAADFSGNVEVVGVDTSLGVNVLGPLDMTAAGRVLVRYNAAYAADFEILPEGSITLGAVGQRDITRGLGQAFGGIDLGLSWGGR